MAEIIVDDFDKYMNPPVTGIDFKKVEEALGFELYDWQKDYISGKCEMIKGGRANGKTLAFVLKQLLVYEKKIPYISKYPDFYKNGFKCDRWTPMNYVAIWFPRYVHEIAKKLYDNGVDICFK